MDWSFVFEVLLSLLTLTFLEIVLGVDNLIFISIASAKLPLNQQKAARRVGLLLALFTRLLLLASVVWLIGLTKPLLTVFGHGFSGRDLFLIAGGLFLLFKSTQEIHGEFEMADEVKAKAKYAKFSLIVIQIAILDIVFSLDSIFTAVGMTQKFWIMAMAITIAIICMIFASEPLGKFVLSKPTIKMLALSFLILIGTILIADGFGYHVPREYIYFALAFSVGVESLNLLLARKKNKLKREPGQG